MEKTTALMLCRVLVSLDKISSISNTQRFEESCISLGFHKRDDVLQKTLE